MFQTKEILVASTFLYLSGVIWATCPPSEYSDLKGEIQSPGFNSTGKYSANLNCNYSIRVPEGKRIILDFKNFSILGSMPKCSEDSVEIIVGCSYKTSIGKFCSCSNLSMPDKIFTFDNCLTLVFKSDRSNEGIGFLAEYITADNTTKMDPSGNCSNDSVMSSHGTLFSPNWPLTYPESQKCVWKFNPPMGKIVRFSFFSLRFIDDESCPPDNPIGIDDAISVSGTNTSGSPVKIRKRICVIPLDNVLVIKNMKTIEILFSSNDDKLDDESGFMAGYATYIEGYVDSSVPTGCSLMPAPTTTGTTSTSSPTSRVNTTNTSIWPSVTESSKLSGGEIAGIAVGAVAGAVLLSVLGWFIYTRCCKKPKTTAETKVFLETQS